MRKLSLASLISEFCDRRYIGASDHSLMREEKGSEEGTTCLGLIKWQEHPSQ